MTHSHRAVGLIAFATLVGCATQTGDQIGFGGTGNGGAPASSGGNGGSVISGAGQTGLGGVPGTGGMTATGGTSSDGGSTTAGSGGTGNVGPGGSGSGGASTGGTSTGGTSTGGTNTGGVSTGGASTGGVSTGGASTGGVSTGGTSTGGTNTGGTGGACTTATYQGENMTPSASGIGQVQGTYYYLWSNGSLSTTATFTGGNTITVYAGGTAADSSHNPHLIVEVNGTAIGNASVAPGTTFNPYSFNYTGSGSQTLAVRFDNDFYDSASGGDTNLYVDRVVVSCGTSSGTGGSGGTGGTAGTGGTGGTGGSTGGTGGTGGTGATGGTGGTGATGGTGGTGGTTGTVSGMPVPPTSNVAKPSGTVGGLKVLNWAGFKGAVSFSFDDSLSSQIQHYAELQATGVRMTFYLVSNNNASSSTWTQAARDGHELGNHTAHHCHDNGTGCAWGTYAGSLGTEDDQCTTHITQTFGVNAVYTSAAPYGDGGYASPAQSRFLLNRGVAGGQIAPGDSAKAYSLPCYTAQPNDPASSFNTNTDSARSAGRWQVFLIHSLGGDGGYNPISITQLVSAIDHAKSLGDVWADSVVNVGAYWRAAATLNAVTPQTSGSTITYTWTLPAHFPPGHYLRVTVTGGTLKQGNTTLAWDSHGYYEVALDAGSLTVSP